MPFLSQPPLFPGGESEVGTSDIVFSTFFSPKESRFIWGVGPVFGLPTTTDPALGSGKWQAGPTVVGLQNRGKLTYGILANHLWSFADASDDPRAQVSYRALGMDFDDSGGRNRFSSDLVLHGPAFGVSFNF